MVWNIMDKKDFHVNNVSLPDLSVKSGRNGVALSLGFRLAIDKIPKMDSSRNSQTKCTTQTIR